MWLLVSLALAADPPVPAGPAATTPLATLATPPLLVCEGTQRCDDRCIPWASTCPSVLADTVKESIREDQEQLLLTTLCTGSPHRAQRPKTPETIAALAIAESAVASIGDRRTSIADARALPSEWPSAPPPPVSAPPPCGPPTEPVPAR
ncbi:MAG: hypothetical protein Q8P18_07630 [Pseudomonadota bacterium]|nr:hypothetical protein [Pseudomonadota bacterium]